MAKITPLNWKDGIPTSNIYDDIYFSKESGLAETTHVFLEGNKLPIRWQGNLSNFHIVETGFGTGLNFLASCKLWFDMACDGQLHFTSIEKHPLSIKDIKQAISYWPELNLYLHEFARQYPKNPQGEYMFKLFDAKIHLRIIWSDIHKALPLITVPADAWFLDGFSPSKNPQMWGNNLYQHMAKLTSPGGSFSTFTSSGSVRRGLQNNGFKVKKADGFGQKRHILVGNIVDNVLIR